MTIRVSVPSIDDESYNKILNYYNENKNSNQQNIEKLNRVEGGFFIEILENFENNKIDENYCDVNCKIKQLRWNKRRLVPYSCYASFSEMEEKLLFESMKHILGEDKVCLE